MSGNHTPTPWSVEFEADYEDEQPKVYVCSSATQCDLTVVATMGEALSISLERKKANARLIAAAPDLLEALTKLRDADDMGKPDGHNFMGPELRAATEAALSKAQGTQS